MTTKKQLQKQVALLQLSQSALMHDRDRHKNRSAKRLEQIRKLKSKGN